MISIEYAVNISDTSIRLHHRPSDWEFVFVTFINYNFGSWEKIGILPTLGQKNQPNGQEKGSGI